MKTIILFLFKTIYWFNKKKIVTRKITFKMLIMLAKISDKITPIKINKP